MAEAKKPRKTPRRIVDDAGRKSSVKETTFVMGVAQQDYFTVVTLANALGKTYVSMLGDIVKHYVDNVVAKNLPR